MTTGDQNGHFSTTRIEVEPTELQRAAYALTEAFGSPEGVDWTTVEANYNTLTGGIGHDSPLIEQGRSAAFRINETLLAGRQPSPADLGRDSFRTGAGRQRSLVAGQRRRADSLLAVMAHRKLASPELHRDAHR